MTFAEFLIDFRARVEPLEIDAADAAWESNTHSDARSEARAARAIKAITRIYADSDTFATLKSFAVEAADSPDDERQYTLLYNAFLAAQKDDAIMVEIVDTETRVESVYNTFRAPLRGETVADNALREMLRTSGDSDLRRDAWEATKAIGPVVESDVRALVALRNAEARLLGYPDHYHMALALQEMEIDSLFAILNAVEAATDAPFWAYKARLDQTLADRFEIDARDLRAYHYADPFFQQAPVGDVDLDRFYAPLPNLPAVATTFFDAIGLDVRDILDRSDLYERPAKCQHAFALHVGRYEDVRILCNCTSSEQWMGTLLHELGHAVYDKYLGGDLPFFLRDVSHILTTEAIAMLLGRFSRDATFLTAYAGVTPGEARAVSASAAREQSASLLVFARWCLVMAHFERALYAAKADTDLNALWWVLVARFQGITPPDNRPSRPDWAAKLHLALTPIYYHNYLLGEMFASQMLDYLYGRVGMNTSLVASPAVGDYLKTAVFTPGARLRWDHLVEAATGEPLNPAHFVGHLASVDT